MSAPALKKIAALPAVSSLREVLSSFSSVVITGGSSGIGKSFIELCGKLKPELLVCNLSRRVPVINRTELKLRHFPCDLARSEEISRVANEVEQFLRAEQKGGRVLLINNSGFGSYGHFPEPNLAHNLEMLDVNVRAVVELTGRMLPLLKERGGAIMNIASTAAFQPTAYLATYGASKTFVLHWSLALNEELRGSGVSALCVCPGPTATEFFRRAGLQQGSVSEAFGMSSESVAVASLRALGRGRAQLVPGWKNKVSSFMVSKLPKPLVARIAAVVLARYRLKQVRK